MKNQNNKSKIAKINLRLTLTICLLGLPWFALLGQTRVVSGCLAGSGNEALPGVSILIKGTTIGTVTDINGCYRIECDLGDILIFSFVGFLSEEIEVSQENSVPISNGKGNMTQRTKSDQGSPPAQLISAYDNNSKILEYNPDTSNTDFNVGNLGHVTVFGSGSKSYQNEYSNNSQNYLFNGYNAHNNFMLNNIKDGKNYKLEFSKNQKYIKLPCVSYDFAIGVNEPCKFPSLQKEYSQGRANNGEFVWRGAETNEIFSWGPKLENLEYDGSDYEFDENGKFVNKGYGNGVSPVYNDPLKFVNNGVSSSHKMRVYYSDENSKAEMNFRSSNQKGIFKDSQKDEKGFSTHLSKCFFGWITPGIDFKINSEQNNLMTEGPWLSKIIQSVFLTPPGFDLYSGFSPNNKKLFEPYLLYAEEGSNTQRSFAPDSYENPYWLVKNTIDESSFDRIFLNAFLNISRYNFSAKLNASLDRQDDEAFFGIPVQTVLTLYGKQTIRNEQVESLFSNLTLQYNYQSYPITWKIISTTDVGKNDKILNVKNYSIANEIPAGIGKNIYSSSRIWYNLGLHSDFNYKEIVGVSTKNSFYSSNSLHPSEDYLFSWSLGTYFNATRLRGVSSSFLELLKLRLQYGTSRNEQVFNTPFRYNNSLLFNAEDFASVYRQDFASVYELQKLKSEKHRKFNLGIDVENFYSRIGWNIEFFSGTTKDLISPVWLNNTTPELKNILDLKTTGAEIDISVRYFNYYRIRSHCKISFTTFNQKVTALHSDNDEAYLPISGFNDVFLAAVEGEEYGVIIGNSYLRNSSGEFMVDEDGYPVVLNEPQIIGNPNPDFMLGFYNSFGYEKFTLDFLLDVKKGGQKWNGTLNTLKYHGVSQVSVEDRQTNNYIYDGINIQTGNQNTQVVNFADPNENVAEFKSVRYGVGGVAEDAIVDASWIRLKNISLNYYFNCGRFNNTQLFKVNLTATVRNAFVISKYDGVDPETTLFGMDNTTGLDYFNLPNLRVYEFKIGISF